MESAEKRASPGVESVGMFGVPGMIQVACFLGGFPVPDSVRFA